MKLSDEELERIKQSNRAKDLHKIIAQEQEKKDTDSDEDGDENFITNRNGKNSGNDSKTTRDNTYKQLKNELSKTVRKLRNAIRPVNTELRSLDNEVGGLEVDYKEIQKITDRDVDVWDDQAQKIAKVAIEIVAQDKEEDESFIHSVKTGAFGRGRKRKRQMGQVNLSEAARDQGEGDDKKVGFVRRFGRIKEDQSQIGNGPSL